VTINNNSFINVGVVMVYGRTAAFIIDGLMILNNRFWNSSIIVFIEVSKFLAYNTSQVYDKNPNLIENFKLDNNTLSGFI
jgi:hypothetical protein